MVLCFQWLAEDMNFMLMLLDFKNCGILVNIWPFFHRILLYSGHVGLQLKQDCCVESIAVFRLKKKNATGDFSFQLVA